MDSIIVNHKERWLGNNMLPGHKPVKFKGVYGDFPNQPMLTRNQWRPVSYSRWVPEVLDQDGVGACNAFCTILIMHMMRAMAGLPYLRLSTGYLYGNINGQQDQGSNLEDALNWMKEKGTVPQSMVDMLEWRKRDWPSGCAVEAKKNRILEAYWCPSFEHVASASTSGYLCNLGLWWGDNDNPDSNGRLPERDPRNGGGHSVPGIGIAPAPGSSTKWDALSCNSWGRDFGDDGRFKIPESRLTADMSTGMWAIVAASAEDEQLPPDLPTPAA